MVKYWMLFHQRLGARQGCLSPLLLFSTVLEVLNGGVRLDVIKGIHPGKEVKPSLFADDMILYKENPEKSTNKLLELINKFNKVAGYKIKILKSIVFLHSNKINPKMKL